MRAAATVLAILVALVGVARAETAGPDRTCAPGQVVIVMGSGASPGAPLLLVWGARTVGGGLADQRGAYRLTLAVGQERPGAHDVQVVTRGPREPLLRFRCVVPGPGVSTPAPTTTGAPTSPTATPGGPTVTPTPPPFVAGQCESAYPDFCLPIGVDVDCPDIPWKNFRIVDDADPYKLDGNDNDGIACESS